LGIREVRKKPENVRPVVIDEVSGTIARSAVVAGIRPGLPNI